MHPNSLMHSINIYCLVPGPGLGSGKREVKGHVISLHHILSSFSKIALSDLKDLQCSGEFESVKPYYFFRSLQIASVSCLTLDLLARPNLEPSSQLTVQSSIEERLF